MNIGNNTPGILHSGQPYHISPNLPLSTHIPSVAPSPIPVLNVPSAPYSASSAPLVPLHDTSDSINNRVTNLVKPSSFFTPPSSSAPMLMTPPLSFPTSSFHPPLNQQQRPHGTPVLQPFPPPTPSPLLTPASATAPNHGPASREKVRDALLMLVQVFLAPSSFFFSFFFLDFF